MSEEIVRRLLSKEAAVEFLGGAPITVKTVEALVRRRELAHVKIGRGTFFSPEALDEYIKAHTVQAEPTPWGLTDAGVRSLRAGRAKRAS